MQETSRLHLEIMIFRKSECDFHVRIIGSPLLARLSLNRLQYAQETVARKPKCKCTWRDVKSRRHSYAVLASGRGTPEDAQAGRLDPNGHDQHTGGQLTCCSAKRCLKLDDSGVRQNPKGIVCRAAIQKTGCLHLGPSSNVSMGVYNAFI